MGCTVSQHESHSHSPKSHKKKSKHDKSKKEKPLQPLVPLQQQQTPKKEQQPNTAPPKFEKELSQEEMVAQTKKYIEISKQVQAYEARNIPKSLQLKKEQLKAVNESFKKIENEYKTAQIKVAKEKSDVDKLQHPSARSFFKDQTSFDETMSKEQEEHLEAVSAAEVIKKQLDGIAQQKQALEKEVGVLDKEMGALMKLYEKQDTILGKIFGGKYGSELENKLEFEYDSLFDRKERIALARYRWSYARYLLQHAVVQLSTACMRWMDLTNIPPTNVQAKFFIATLARNNIIAAAQNIRSAQRYLSNIRFPYCEPNEIITLERACYNIYIDMQFVDRHRIAFQVYDSTCRRAAALLQWFDSVINGTIEKDLATALKALSAADSALRKERLSLIREKVGKAADGLIINESAIKEDDFDPEMVAVCQPEKAEGGNDMLSAGDSGPPRSVTPMPLNELAPPPSHDELFGNIEQLKQQHEKEMEEFEKAQETNKARLEQGLEEKLRERRNRRARMTSPS